MAEVDFLVKIRDAACMVKDACEEKLERLAPTNRSTQVQINEEFFQALFYEKRTTGRLGEHEDAMKEKNDATKFQPVFDFLVRAQATIGSRFHQRDYVYGYWIYGPRIFRKKLSQTG
jgi:hypothetical protein